ncbi:MAG TPA: hypothetical protein VHZ07_20620 [Bryobacteraceae bacterium]|jgi:hypothetical protein|nr:hypothetical protein [Bryobacteraceae bacterium]
MGIRAQIISGVLGFALVLASAAPVSAQYGGGSIPVPWGHKDKKKSSQKNEENVQQTMVADGHVISNDSKAVVMFVDDGRTLTLKLTPDTVTTRKGAKIAVSDILPNATVHIETNVDDEDYLTATLIDVTKDPPAPVPVRPPTRTMTGAPAAHSTGGQEDIAVRPTIMSTPVDAPDRPVLHHGKPTRSEDSGNTPTAAPVSPPIAVASNSPKPDTSRSASAPASSDSTDFTINAETVAKSAYTPVLSGLIAKTKDWSQTFTQGLPNFVCRQLTTRYQEESRSSGFQAIDMVTATVVYEDGHESYRDITVGGHKVNKKMSEIGGSTSTGEFASTLASLFSDYTQAGFRRAQTTSIGQTSAVVYDFKVLLKHSDWRIVVGGQMLEPAYSGSVWIDSSTGHVRRIEMSANNIPKDFPLDTVEWAVDYDHVSLDATHVFLLPVHAENLSCQRGSTICTKNAVDFRDYHKYSGESSITFGN